MNVSKPVRDVIDERTVPVNKDIVESKIEYEGLELLLNLQICLVGFLPREDVK